MNEKQILITIDAPKGWDEEDWDYLVERLGYTLSRELIKSSYTIQEFEK